jgi:hypothetical protein
MREVDGIFVAEQPEDGVDPPLVASRRRQLQAGGAGAPQGRQRGGDLVGGQYVVDVAAAQGAERHAVELRGFRGLTNHGAAGAADFLHAARAVAAAAGEHHRDRPAAHVLRQGSEEQVDRQRQSVPGVLVVQQELPLPDDHFLHRRQQVDRVGLDRHVVIGLPDTQGRATREQLVHQTLEVGRQVLQHDECHARVSRKLGEQPLERIEAARRRTNGHDVKLVRGKRRGVFCQCGLAFPIRDPFAIQLLR